MVGLLAIASVLEVLLGALLHRRPVRRLPPGVDEEQLLTVMARDKKAIDRGLTFVLDGPAGLEVVRSVAVGAVHDALLEVQAP